MFGSNLWGTLVGSACRVPVVIAQEHTWSYEGAPWRVWLDGQVIGRLATRFVAVSEADAERMVTIEHVPTRKVTVVPTAYVPQPEGSTDTDLRAELGLAPDTPLYGSASNMRPQKALEVMLDAHAKLLETSRAPTWRWPGTEPRAPTSSDASESCRSPTAPPARRPHGCRRGHPVLRRRGDVVRFRRHAAVRVRVLRQPHPAGSDRGRRAPRDRRRRPHGDARPAAAPGPARGADRTLLRDPPCVSGCDRRAGRARRLQHRRDRGQWAICTRSCARARRRGRRRSCLRCSSSATTRSARRGRRRWRSARAVRAPDDDAGPPRMARHDVPRRRAGSPGAQDAGGHLRRRLRFGLEQAYPILSSLGMPATVFAPTSFMSERQPLQWSGIDHWLQTDAAPELRGMSWEDLGRLHEDGWEVGSHTRTHPRLTNLDDAAVRDELAQSRHEIATQLSAPCETVAYPYGDVDARVADAAESAGYLAGAALASGLRPEGRSAGHGLGSTTATRCGASGSRSAAAPGGCARRGSGAARPRDDRRAHLPRRRDGGTAGRVRVSGRGRRALQARPERFEAHLDAIAATGVTVGLIGGGSQAALTFDDGGASALACRRGDGAPRLAWPLLHHHRPHRHAWFLDGGAGPRAGAARALGRQPFALASDLYGLATRGGASHRVALEPRCADRDPRRIRPTSLRFPAAFCPPT